MASVRLNVSGMTCNHCKVKVEQALSGTFGVYGVFVDLPDGAAEVDYDDGKVTSDALVKAVKGAGYEAQGLYRPSADCIMFTRDEVGFCSVCAAAIERIIDLYSR